jgi:hypothetical protein
MLHGQKAVERSWSCQTMQAEAYDSIKVQLFRAYDVAR